MPALTFTFLGTGTSQGVPMIGCSCRVCTSPDPRDTRMRSSLYVESEELSWVIDTGPDFRAQCLRYGVRRVEAVVYTHAHTDHIMGFDDLRPFCPGGKALPVYGSEETLGLLRRAFEFAFNGRNRFPGYIFPEARVVSGRFPLGELELTPLPVPHGRTTVFGYLISRAGAPLLAYLSDCKAVPEPAASLIKGVPHLIVDALRTKPHPTHMSVAEALAVAAEAGAGQTYFTHLCHDLLHAELEASLPAGVRVAFDGLRITI